MKDNFVPSCITAYATAVSRGESLILHKLREETSKLPEAEMMITPLQGRILEFLVRWGRVTRILEIGTFTGYSALVMALALPPEGTLLTLDKHEEWGRIAQKYWALAGISSKIELRLGMAHETLKGLNGYFDLIFVDADKQRYPFYYEVCFSLLRSGGLIIFDNTLWKGDVADLKNQEETPQSLRNFNKKLQEDNRIHPVLLPLVDGMTLAIKL